MALSFCTNYGVRTKVLQCLMTTRGRITTNPSMIPTVARLSIPAEEGSSLSITAALKRGESANAWHTVRRYMKTTPRKPWMTLCLTTASFLSVMITLTRKIAVITMHTWNPRKTQVYLKKTTTNPLMPQWLNGWGLKVTGSNPLQTLKVSNGDSHILWQDRRHITE